MENGGGLAGSGKDTKRRGQHRIKPNDDDEEENAADIEDAEDEDYEDEDGNTKSKKVLARKRGSGYKEDEALNDERKHSDVSPGKKQIKFKMSSAKQ